MNMNSKLKVRKKEPKVNCWISINHQTLENSLNQSWMLYTLETKTYDLIIYQMEEEALLLSDEEIPVNDLSGDEALEAITQSMHSSLWGNKNKTNKPMTIVSIIKSNIGVGILGMPNIAKNFGLIPMVIILLAFHFVTLFTIGLLVKSKNLCKHSNISSIGYAVFEKRWILKLINLMIVINNFGMTLAEMIVFATVSNNLMSVFLSEPIPFYGQKWFLALMVSILIFPITLLKQIERLRFVSLLGLISIAVFTACVMINYIREAAKEGAVVPADGFGLLYPPDFSFSRAFGCLPTVIMAYQWQFNLFPIFKGMQEPSDKKFLRACYEGEAYVSLFYIGVGALGYLTYGKAVEANYLEIVDRNSIGTGLYVVLNICYILQTATMMPLMFLGARNNLIQFLKPQAQVADEMRIERTNKRYQEIRFVLYTFLLWALMTAGAITLDSLEIAFNLVGAVSSNAIGIVFPCLFYLKLTKRKGKMYEFVKVMFVVALMLTVVCLVSEYIKIFL